MTEETKKIFDKWFELKYNTYDKIEYNGSIYLYHEDQEYAQIRIDNKDRTIIYNWDLYEEFYEIIPIYGYEFHNNIIKYVEDVTNLRGFTTYFTIKSNLQVLKIPK